MPEHDIGKQVEKYWENFRRQLNDEDAEKLNQILKELFDLPSVGFYRITAYAYDDEDALLDEYLIISQMLVILLS
jgi:hypothetical protein